MYADWPVVASRGAQSGVCLRSNKLSRGTGVSPLNGANSIFLNQLRTIESALSSVRLADSQKAKCSLLQLYEPIFNLFVKQCPYFIINAKDLEYLEMRSLSEIWVIEYLL